MYVQACDQRSHNVGEQRVMRTLIVRPVRDTFLAFKASLQRPIHLS